ncbi:MAG: class I SAM-dependent methyltransferase, partial [Acidobacteriota bacterium]|nr:class I SAM-dependent methyltransferase [Acidobacteriota bacterium]
MNVPTSKLELKELILKALGTQYTSESCKDRIQTGNHYQSITLGDRKTSGFRTSRDELLNRIDFKGKKVLDLGSNLGEISRAVRARGASLVDGFEYDPYFIETANLINAYNEVTRVSFYQRDITEPSVYVEQYDIVIALSVFTYVQTVLDKIAQITKQAFIVETHKLEGDLETAYLMPLLQHFPCYQILGESEWGIPLDNSQKRAVIIFAKDEAKLAAALDVSSIELNSSTEAGQPIETQALAASAPIRYIRIDVDRTSVHERFFSVFKFDTSSELLKTIAGTEIDLDAIAQSHDAKHYVYSGWVYWLLYIKGYLQYRESRTIGRGNIFYDYLVRYYIPRDHDPGLRELANRLEAISRVAQRFRDFEFFHDQVVLDSSKVDNIAPVVIIVRDQPADDWPFIYEVGSETPLRASTVDGYHRLFIAKLFGVE